MVQALLHTDILITNAINAFIPHTYFFDLFFSFFSLRGNSILIWLVIALLLVFFEERIDKRFVVYLGLSIMIVSLLVVGLKNLIRRPRPIITYTSLQKVIGGKTIKTCDTDFSFPSGHSSLAFAAAGIIAAFDRKRKYGYYFIAVIIGLSRIYLQCHFFLDVVGGGMIGYLISRLVLMNKKLLTFHF